MAYRCSMCLSFVAGSLKLLLNHMRRSHANDSNFHVLCGLDGCPRTYKRFLSFRNHLIRKHNFKLTDEDQRIGIFARELAQETEDFERLDAALDEDVPELPVNEDCIQSKQIIKESNALCLLGFKDKGRVPQTVVNLFAERTTQLVRNSLQFAEKEIDRKLRAVGTSIQEVPGLKQIFEEDSLPMNPFNGLENEKQQSKFYKENFDLVEPRKIILGRYHVKVRRGSKLKEVEKTDEAIYIPILSSLQQLLNDESIWEEVEHPHTRDDGLLGDFCDTDYFRSHPLFGVDPFALQLLLYFDELEVCNPLGTRANKHKLAALYYTLGNIKPGNRSHLNAIQLLGLMTCPNLKKYGIEPLLEAFMEDLCKLEQDEGHLFHIKEEVKHIRGTIAYFSADNLGAQYIGGYKIGSSAHRKCRECMGKNEEIQTQFCEDCFVLRTKESYEYQCQQLDQDDHFKKTYGLNNRSVLNNSRYYHVVGGMPADAMHDILEGVLQYTIKEILKVFILEKKFFSLESLNCRIASFDYGYHNDTNKPAPIQRKRLLSNDNSLKQHANQMWCLGLHLPLLIGENIPDDDDHWELLGTLLEIVRIVFSPLLSKNQVPYLQILIQEHHEKFKELFPQCSIIPKMHYMLHMPRNILRLGPLVGSWCMRYEAKHHYFKHLAIVIGNFINLPFSLAKRHQEAVTYRLKSAEGNLSSFIHKGVEIGPGKKCYVGDIPYEILIKAEDEAITSQTPVYEAKWVLIQGTKYKVGATLHIGYSEDELPLFWEVEKILVLNKCISSVMFIVSEKETLNFNKHFQSYEVITPANRTTKIVYTRDFSCFLPLNQAKPVRVQTNSKFICYRYDLEA